MEIFYDGPTQLRFWRPDKHVYRYGIACHEYIIDVTDGTLFSTKKIIDCAPCNADNAIIEYGDWKDLSYNFGKI